MAAGFAVLGAAGPVNIIGKAILNIIAACLLAWFALRLRRNARDQYPPRTTPRNQPPACQRNKRVTGNTTTATTEIGTRGAPARSSTSRRW